MRFNVILEDGGIYRNSIVLTTRGIAETKRDIHCALKYDGFICICNKYVRNKRINSKDVYEVESVLKIIKKIEELE